MATPATLTDVIDRLRAEGQLTRNTGTNSIKSIRIELSAQTAALQEMLKIMQAQQVSALLGRTSQDSGSGNGAGGKGTGRPSPSAENPIIAAFMSLKSLGTLGRIAAGAIGAALGVVIGQFKTIRVFFPKTVDKIVKPITDFVDNFRARMTALSASIMTKLAQVGTAITNAITFVEGVFSSAAARINSLGKLGKGFTGTVSYIYETLKRIVKVFTDVGKMIGGAFKTALNLSDAASSILAPLKKFLGAIKSVAGAVGKLFVPLGVVLTLFDTIKGTIDGYTEGGILGALEGGITGFFNSLIFGPLDLVKDLVSWVAGKLGFENFSKLLDDFSFSELFSKIISQIFAGVKSAIEVVTDLFSFGDQDKTALGLLGKLTDLVYAPVNMAINFVRGLFGFEDDGEPFKLQDFIKKSADDAWEWFKGLFGNLTSILPSMEELTNALLDMMPDWMRKLVGAPERAASQIVEEQVAANKAELESARARLARSQTGENVYYGRESVGQADDQAIIDRLQAVVEAPNPQIAVIQQKLASLEAEAVELEAAAREAESTSGIYIKPNTSRIDSQIAEYQSALREENMKTSILAPRTPTSSRRTDAEMLAAASASIGSIAENQQAILAMAERNALQTSGSPTIIVNAPTVAPVNNNVTGPTSVSNQRVTSIGTGGNGTGVGRFAN
jgi:hypothetical protein